MKIADSLLMKILSPLSGSIIPLDLVPDPVFSQKMVGDGLAIDPTDSLLRSPIEGVVEFIHPGKHAITLKSAYNIEVLIHIGIDTVKLKGEGFKTLVNVGQKVKAGDPLIEFDIDFISTQAKSVMTIVLVTQNQDFDFSNFVTIPVVTAQKTTLFEVNPKKNKSTQESKNRAEVLAVSRHLICPLQTGFHARPAAVIAQAAKNFKSEIHFFKNNVPANAKSITSILTLTVTYNDEITIECFGSDASQAVAEMTKLIENMKEEKSAAPSSVGANSSGKVASDQPHEFHGVMAASGQVHGITYQLKIESLVVEKEVFSKISSVENQKLSAALTEAKIDLNNTIKSLTKGDSDKKEIYQAHLELLSDTEILKIPHQLISEGASAEYAWSEGINQLKTVFKNLNNETMAARALDVHDIGQRVLRILLGIEKSEPLADLPQGQSVILIAKSVNPSDMASFDPKIVKGLCLVEGGASSHVAIIARSMGIASIAAVDEKILEVKNGTEALLYANKGYLNVKPEASEISQIKIEIEKQNQKSIENLKTSHQPATTIDGVHIEVFANIGKHTEAVEALKSGSDGVGLLRSEFLFLDRTTEPSEKEQKDKYQEIISDLSSDGQLRPVIIRTLDVGGDKPLSYYPVPHEENPFLGVRGLRLSLRSPAMFRTQLKSLLQVKPISNLKIMFPMVTTLSELLEAKKILAEEAAKLQVPHVSVGIMIEVPSAALLTEQFAPHVDFFSIGSNDLTQYTLAIDRGHRELATMADGLHPSVLKLIKMTCDAAKKHKKFVGVCGGIASEPFAIPLLIGLGVDELSVSVPTIPHVKAQIRKLKKSECVLLAEKALLLAEASDVRELVRHLI
jgi:multiphosphoryl transfer protein